MKTIIRQSFPRLEEVEEKITYSVGSNTAIDTLKIILIAIALIDIVVAITIDNPWILSGFIVWEVLI